MYILNKKQQKQTPDPHPHPHPTEEYAIEINWLACTGDLDLRYSHIY